MYEQATTGQAIVHGQLELPSDRAYRPHGLLKLLVGELTTIDMTQYDNDMIMIIRYDTRTDGQVRIYCNCKVDEL